METFTQVKTKTTGFSSPAVDYVQERIYFEPVGPDPYFTFYFRIGAGIAYAQISTGDIIEVNRRAEPSSGQMCVGVDPRGHFVLYRFGEGKPDEHWGVITRVSKPNPR